jgi:hypothetical protein
MYTNEDTVAQLRQLGAEHKRLRAELEAVVDLLHPLIVQAAREGVTPTVLVELSDYTRDRVRVICREAGLPPLPSGRRPRNAK